MSSMRRLGWTAGISSAFVVAAGLVALGDLTPAVAVGCPTMQVVGVRGSGEKSTDYEGYGRTVKAVVDQIKQIVPAVDTDPINYKAIEVLYGGIKYPSEYVASVADGEIALQNYITDFVASPCGDSTYLYLVGFSQGAHVVDNVYERLETLARGRVGGVALIGDPRFYGQQGEPVAVGTYSPKLSGVAVSGRIAKRFVVTETSKFRSYCLNGDPVCNFSKKNAAPCLAFPGSCVHLAYPDTTFPPASLTYTALAASFLIERWRTLGPQPPAGTIRTFAGSADAGFCGDGRPAVEACLYSPVGVAVDNADNVYIADTNNNRVRKVAADGTIDTIAGDGTMNSSCGDGGPAVEACLNNPVGLAVDDAGSIYISEHLGHRVRKVAGDGTISTVAGNGTPGFCIDGAQATGPCLNQPVGVALDGAGNLYIADAGNGRVRRVAADGSISTVAGDGSQTYCGDGGPATRACLWSAPGIAVDGSGNLYIADLGNSRVRKVAGDGTISTVAGNGTQGFCVDGVPATGPCLSGPYGVSIDSSGNLYVADIGDSRIKRVAADGTISTLAGNGSFDFCGDNGPAIDACFRAPASLAIDDNANVYIADTQNNRIRRVYG